MGMRQLLAPSRSVGGALGWMSAPASANQGCLVVLRFVEAGLEGLTLLLAARTWHCYSRQRLKCLLTVFAAWLAVQLDSSFDSAGALDGKRKQAKGMCE